MKTLVGIVAFGNTAFTELAIAELYATTKEPFALFVVVGKPGDLDTVRMLETFGDRDIRFLAHDRNEGFPASINDLCDEAWTMNDYDHLIVMGNDVVPMPGAVDAMIREAALAEYDWICASQFDVRFLCDRYPEARRFFRGDQFEFTDFRARPWELHEPTRQQELANGSAVSPGSMSDVRNLCLFRQAVFDRIGYADVNYWPGGYFEDNDYCRRAQLAGIRACTIPAAAYFHFWSRTIHQQGGSTTGKLFERNRSYYQAKWGGPVGKETVVPSGDRLAILDRAGEADFIRYWQNKI